MPGPVGQVGLQRLDAVNNFRLNSLLTDGSRVAINNVYSSLRYDKTWQRGSFTLEGGYANGRPDREYSLELTGNPKYSYRPNYDYQSANLRAEGGFDPLGERLQLDSGTLTPLLKRLEALGLVQRLRDTADERRVLLQLTAAGRSLKTRAQQVPRAIAAASGCELDELSSLTSRLQALRARISASPPRAA